VAAPAWNQTTRRKNLHLAGGKDQSPKVECPAQGAATEGRPYSTFNVPNHVEVVWEVRLTFVIRTSYTNGYGIQIS